MFGMGFVEILLIAVVAILFLGPEKLPKAMVDIARFFKAVKKTINDAKETLDRETHLSEIKDQALEYKKSLEIGGESFKSEFSLDDLDALSKNSSSDSKNIETPIKNDSGEIAKKDSATLKSPNPKEDRDV